MVMNRLRNFVKNVAVTHFSIKLFLVYAVSVIVFKGINLSFPLYLLLLAAEFICVMVQLQRHGDAVTDDEQPELFEEHRYDLQRVKGLLASTPIFGIDSSWGNGKSFVVDYLVKEPDIQAVYFVIKIEALAYQFE